MGNGYSEGSNNGGIIGSFVLRWLPLALSGCALFQAIFVVGSKTGQIDEHLKSTDAQIAEIKLNKAERGEITAQIEGLKEVQKITAANQDELRKLLEEQAGMYGDRNGRYSSRRGPGG
jgi:hypothetical protein